MCIISAITYINFTIFRYLVHTRYYFSYCIKSNQIELLLIFNYLKKCLSAWNQHFKKIFVQIFIFGICTVFRKCQFIECQLIMLVYVTFGHKCRKTSLNISYNYFRHLVLYTYIKKYYINHDSWLSFFLWIFLVKTWFGYNFFGVGYLVSLFLVLHIFKIDVLPNCVN